MEPNVCFEPSIDSNTLKHLVTDVPDPPKSACEANFLELAGIPQQHNNFVSSRTLKHLVTDVPDPPEEFICHQVWDYSLFQRYLSNDYKMENKTKILTQKSLKTLLTWDKKSIVLLCLSLFLPVTVCDIHRLSYHHTGLYYPEEGRYYFETVGYVDDQEIDMYTSESHVDIPKTAWMEKNEDDYYWERQTSLRRGWEKVFRDNLMILASRFNYTKRSHTLQLSYGCQLQDDEVGSGYYQYGFDGIDFLIFQSNTLLWIAGTQKAEISAQRWNSDRAIGEGVKLYLTYHCTSSLKKYIGYGKEELERKVRPKMKVSGRRQSDGATRLQCLVYGFHPRAVDVKWMKNGVDLVPSYESTPILPHPDGTYQIKVGVEVPTSEEDAYSCHVEHSSLGDETLRVRWEPHNGLSMTVIIAIVCAIVVIIGALGVGIFFYKKRERGYKTASNSDNNSDSSNNPTA